MDQHIETSKINHELLLLKTVKNLKQKSAQCEKKLKIKDSEIKQLKELNRKKDEKLNEMNKKIEQNEEKIHNLTTFAERISKLHVTLSDKSLTRNEHYRYTLFQEKYETNEEVCDWNKVVEEVNEDENECEYLETLKESINRYKEIIYSTTFKERIVNFCCLTPPGFFTSELVKLTCLLTTTFIQIKQFHDFDEFQKHFGGKVLFENFGDLFTYYVGDVLHVAFYEESRGGVYLLHFSEEDKKLHLPDEETVEMNDIWEYVYNDLIVLYFEFC